MRDTFESVRSGFRLCLRALNALMLGMIVIRIAFHILAESRLEMPQDIMSLHFHGLAEDVFYLLIVLFFSLPIVLLLEKYSKKAANMFMLVLALLVLLIEFSLSYYFTISFQPLGNEILLFSGNDLSQIVGPEISRVPWLIWSLMVVGIGLIIWRWSKSLPEFKRWKATAFLAFSIIALLYHFSFRDSFGYTDMDKGFACNKTVYLISKCHNRIDVSFPEDGYPNEELAIWKKNFPEYRDSLFPFMKEWDGRDVLSEYLGESDKKPNLVFIVVESLSRTFSGPDSTVKLSFTPFLDSLANHGLYWTNCYSTAERTFGALPSIFASAPAGQERGFINYGDRIPQFLSLQHILKKEGYSNKFFFAGWIGFDQMEQFFNRMPMDFVLDKTKFGKDYKLMGENGVKSWGYGDKDLFNKFFDLVDSTVQPRCDVFLTLSMHTPYVSGDTKEYRTKFKNRISHLSDLNQDYYKRRESELRSVLYTDDALRDFFNRMKELPEYDNTIFIITGDHNIGVPFQKSEEDKFKVPLLVYKPNMAVGSMSNKLISHLDITPMILGWLEKSIDLNVPKRVPFLGSVADSNERVLFFQDLSGDVSGMFVNGEFTPIKSGTSDLVRSYKVINEYVQRNNALYPGDLSNEVFSGFFDMEKPNPFLTFPSDNIAFRGRHSMSLKPDHKYSDSVQVDLPQAFRSVVISAQFKYYCEEDVSQRKKIELVVNVYDEEGKEVYRDTENINYDNIDTGQWCDINTGESFNLESAGLKKGNKYSISVHFVTHGLDAYLDDMNFRIGYY